MDPVSPVAHASPLEDGGKPLCGSGEEVGEYDLGIHVLGLCKFSTGSIRAVLSNNVLTNCQSWS